MACKKTHIESDKIVKTLRISQGSFERHKCASCAYEEGLKNGQLKLLHFDLETFIVGLEESQRGDRRHRSALEAYTLGFFHGLNGANNHLAIKDKMNMAAQMRDYGLSLVARGVLAAAYSEHGTPYAHAQAVVSIANGFEILIKARIVEEHPLLVFEQIPKHTKISDGNLKFEDLLEHGKTIMYSELPERLWAATGYQISDSKLFADFGKTRNQIIHFSVPNDFSLADFAIKFAFVNVESAINDWWDTTILEYVGDYEEEGHIHIFDKLNDLKISVRYYLTSAGEIKKLA